jgi:hypothetical protein
MIFLLCYQDLERVPRPRYEEQIERPNKILYPADDLDTQHPVPYIYDSAKEFETYIERAAEETAAAAPTPIIQPISTFQGSTVLVLFYNLLVVGSYLH